MTKHCHEWCYCLHGMVFDQWWLNFIRLSVIEHVQCSGGPNSVFTQLPRFIHLVLLFMYEDTVHGGPIAMNWLYWPHWKSCYLWTDAVLKSWTPKNAHTLTANKTVGLISCILLDHLFARRNVFKVIASCSPLTGSTGRFLRRFRRLGLAKRNAGHKTKGLHLVPKFGNVKKFWIPKTWRIYPEFGTLPASIPRK